MGPGRRRVAPLAAPARPPGPPRDDATAPASTPAPLADAGDAMPETDRPSPGLLHEEGGLSLMLWPGEGAASVVVLAPDSAAVAWAGGVVARLGHLLLDGGETEEAAAQFGRAIDA